MITEQGKEMVKVIGTALIEPDPEQPRRHFDKEALEELAESIRQHGVLVDLLVQEKPGPRRAGEPLYRIVDGERRWRAAKLAGLAQVPVRVRPVADNVLVQQIVLNTQRENLGALEEAAAYQKALEEGPKSKGQSPKSQSGEGETGTTRPTAEQLAKKLGISRAKLFGRLRLNDLDEGTRQALAQGRITVSVAGLVAMVAQEHRAQLLEQISGDDWNGPAPYRSALATVERRFARTLYGARFDPKHDFGNGPGIVWPTCGHCPRRSGNMPGCGLTNPNVCTQPACYDFKTRVAGEEAVRQAVLNGQTALTQDQAARVFDKHGQMAAGNEYIDLADRCAPLGYEYKKEWRTALAKHCPAVVVARDGSGAAHELVPKGEALAALKLAQPKFSWEGKKPANNKWQVAQEKRDQARQAKARGMAGICARSTPGILEKLLKRLKANPLEVWQLLARAAYQHAHMDACAATARRRGWSEKQTGARQSIEGWLKEKHALVEWQGLALELALLGEGYEHSSWSEPKWNPLYVAAAALAGVSLKSKVQSPRSKARKGKGKK